MRVNVKIHLQLLKNKNVPLVHKTQIHYLIKDTICYYKNLICNTNKLKFLNAARATAPMASRGMITRMDRGCVGNALCQNRECHVILPTAITTPAGDHGTKRSMRMNLLCHHHSPQHYSWMKSRR